MRRSAVPRATLQGASHDENQTPSPMVDHLCRAAHPDMRGIYFQNYTIEQKDRPYEKCKKENAYETAVVPTTRATTGYGRVFSLRCAACLIHTNKSQRRNRITDCLCALPFAADAEDRDSGTKKTVLAGTPKPNVVVRVARRVVQIQRRNSGIAAVVPIAAAEKTAAMRPSDTRHPPCIGIPATRAPISIFYILNFFSHAPQRLPNVVSRSLAAA